MEGEWVYENIKYSWLNIVVYFDGVKFCNVELVLYICYFNDFMLRELEK